MSFWNYLQIRKNPSLMLTYPMYYKGARGLNFDQRPHLYPFFVYASSKGSGETVYMSKLARAFVVRRCNKYGADKLVP